MTHIGYGEETQTSSVDELLRLWILLDSRRETADQSCEKLRAIITNRNRWRKGGN